MIGLIMGLVSVCLSECIYTYIYLISLIEFECIYLLRNASHA